MKSTTAGQADSRNNAQHMCSLRSVLNLRGKRNTLSLTRKTR